MSELKQLNPFELKAEIAKVVAKLCDVSSFESYAIHYRLLDAQNDKGILAKLLFKELHGANSENVEIVKFLLLRYVSTDDIVNHLWTIVKNSMASNDLKILALDFLRELDTDWTYEECEGYINTDELVDKDTQKLLDKAIVNPEFQIDFLDFVQSLSKEDKITLLDSLNNDYSGDELANILIPVFLSQPDSEPGREALKLLGNSRSQLAFHALNTSLDFVSDEIRSLVKKNLSILKLSGIREDNSYAFYRELLKESKPYRLSLTYPDGQGNQAMIFSRINEYFKVQFVAIVINDDYGIKDCFGFNELSKFECDTIIDRFYREEKSLDVSPEEFKTILYNAELKSKKAQNWLLPYEYVCWKNLLADIECDNIIIADFLNDHIEKREISADEFNSVLNSDFMVHWFMDAQYSDEFEDFLNELNAKFRLNSSIDLDKTVINSRDAVFYPEEKELWHTRILNCAYLKYITKNVAEAEILYNISQNVKFENAFFEFILKKSIYEYYFSMLYNKDKSVFDAEKLDEIVEKIESKWVK